MKLWILALVALGATACCGAQKAVVRDPVAYKTEVVFMGQAALQQSAHLEGLIKANCTCDANKKFTTEMCEKAAKTALVVKARVPWHQQMMLFNAGLLEQRPDATPPAVSGTETLCP